MKIYNNLNNINKDDWLWIKTLIKVFRKVEYKWIIRKETSYYISSVWFEQMDAKGFNTWIRSHWGIENTLHYSKDVTFREDYSRIITKNAPQNISLIRNIVMNIFRNNGYTNMAQAIRLIANDIPKMLKLILE